MSSFILRYVYSNAGNVEMTENGVSAVYQAVIGETPFVTDEEDEEMMEEGDYYYSDTSEEDEDGSTMFTDGSGIYQTNPDDNSNNSSNNSSNSSGNNLNTRQPIN